MPAASPFHLLSLRSCLTVGALTVATLLLLAPVAEAQNAFRGSNPFEPSTSAMVTGRLVRLLLPIIAGFAIGAFFSPALRRFRTAAFVVAAVAITLFGLFGPYPTADFVNLCVAVVSFLVAFGFGLLLGAKAAVERARGRPTSFGSAKWADLAYLRQHEVIGSKGYMLGSFLPGDDTGPQPLHYTGARHLLTVAPTRSGKGVSSIIPNLLTYRGSALVIDPKGENALITAVRRGPGWDDMAGLGQTIVLLDPWNTAAAKLGTESSGFNPLDWIKADDPDAVENAFLLADALVVSEGTGESRFWDEEAKALLMGLILYVATAVEEAGNRTLGRVRDILTLDNESLNNVLRLMFKHPNPVVSSSASRTAAKDAKLFSSVLASAQSHTHFLDSPRIRESLAQSDFDFGDLKTTAMTIYVILPADRLKTFDRWLRLLIQQAITVNARNIDVKPPRPVLIMLDEMAALGRLETVERAYGLMAGFGMQLWGIVQDLSQLAHIYGETGWQTFISNSGVIQYFGSRDKMTAEYFSDLCGVTTIEVHNFSWAVGYAWSVATSWNASGSSTTHTSTDNWTRTTGTNEAARQLAYPDELMVMKGDQQIVFVENLDPIPSQRIVWYKDPMLKELGIDLEETAAA